MKKAIALITASLAALLGLIFTTPLTAHASTTITLNTSADVVGYNVEFDDYLTYTEVNNSWGATARAGVFDEKIWGNSGDGSSVYQVREVLKFPTLHNTGNLPTNARIYSATLTIPATDTADNTGVYRTMDVMSTDAAWTTPASWTAPPVGTKTYGTISPTSSAQTNYTVDITKALLDWQDNISVNGLIIKQHDETIVNSNWYADGGPTYPGFHPNAQPSLSVTYYVAADPSTVIPPAANTTYGTYVATCSETIGSHDFGAVTYNGNNYTHGYWASYSCTVSNPPPWLTGDSAAYFVGLTDNFHTSADGLTVKQTASPNTLYFTTTNKMDGTSSCPSGQFCWHGISFKSSTPGTDLSASVYFTDPGHSTNGGCGLVDIRCLGSVANGSGGGVFSYNTSTTPAYPTYPTRSSLPTQDDGTHIRIK